MDNNQIQQTQQIQIQQRRSYPKLVLRVISILILIAGVAYGVYAWQHQEVQRLESKIATIESKRAITDNTATAAQNDTYTYRSKVGGLTLSLPDKFPVIVKVDGNKGGSQGATYNIAKSVSSGIINDSVYEYVQIDIDSLSISLEERANFIADQLKKDMFSNIKIAETKVNGIEGRLLTAEGVSYDAKRRIYLAKEGDFIYQITSKTQDASTDGEVLSAVLNAVDIKPRNQN